MFSTPPTEKGSNSWYEKFIEEEKDNILIIIFDRVCDACMKKEIEEWKYCPHTKFEGSLLKNIEDLAELEKKMTPEEIAQELYGVSLVKENLAFQKDTLDLLFDKKNRVDIDLKKVKVYYIYVDTNFGGPNMSTFVVYIKDPNNPSLRVIMWVSSLSCKNPEESESFFSQNIYELRLFSGDSNIPLVIFYETVSNWSAFYAKKLVESKSGYNEFQNIFFCYEPAWIGTARERPGVNVYGSRKNRYITVFRAALIEQKIRIYKRVNNGLGGVTGIKKHIDSEMKEFNNELEKFRGKSIIDIIERKKARTQLDNKNNSGKHMEGGHVVNDDKAFSAFALLTLMDIWEYDTSCQSQRINTNIKMKRQIYTV